MSRMPLLGCVRDNDLGIFRKPIADLIQDSESRVFNTVNLMHI